MIKNSVMLHGGIDFSHSNRGCQALSFGSIDFITSLDPTIKKIILPAYYIRRRRVSEYFELSPDKPIFIERKFYSIFSVFLVLILSKLGLSIFVRRLSFFRDVSSCRYFFNVFGGDSFSDIYGTKQFLEFAIPSLIAIMLKMDHVLLPQTFGPFQRKAIPFYVGRFIVRRSSSVYARDIKSMEFISETYNYEVKLSSDVSFLLPPKEIRLEIKSNGLRVVGINISGLCYFNSYRGVSSRFDAYKNLMISLIHRLSEHYYIIFIPHTYNTLGTDSSSDDLAAIIEFISHIDFPIQYMLIENNFSYSELKFIISKCDYFIGSRMHSIFSSIDMRIPFYALSYSYKFSSTINLYSEFGSHTSIINIDSSEVDNIVDKIVIDINQKLDNK